MSRPLNSLRASAITLVALALASTGGLVPALAAPAGDVVIFEMDAAPKSLATMCVGQTKKIYVSVTRLTTKTINSKEYEIPAPVNGVNVNGQLISPGVGGLSPAKGWITFEDGDYQTADFVFTAKKAGTTTIAFSGLVDSYWVGSGAKTTLSKPEKVHAEVTVKVVPCRPKVHTVQQFDNTTAHPPVTAVLDEVVMTADAQDHYTGSGTLNWIGWHEGYIIFGCWSSTAIGDSQVDLTGDLDANGQLTLKFTYQPAVFTSEICDDVEGGNRHTLSPVAVNLSLPGGDGVANQPEAIVDGPYGEMPGSILAIVSLEPDQSVALNSDSRLPHLGLFAIPPVAR
jgi:hypothetical protein